MKEPVYSAGSTEEGLGGMDGAWIIEPDKMLEAGNKSLS